MVFHKLRIICFVMTGILIVSFWGLAPVGLVYLLWNTSETSFYALSFPSLGAALFMCILGWTLPREVDLLPRVGTESQARHRRVNMDRDTVISVGRGISLIARGSIFGLLGASVFLATCGLVANYVRAMTHGVDTGAGYNRVTGMVLVPAAVLFFVLLGKACTRVYKTASLVSVERVMWLLVGGGLLFMALLVVPNAMFARERSRPWYIVSRGEEIRVAFARYAADSVGNAYPKAEHLRDYATLRALVNQNGGTLPESEAKAGVQLVSYETRDLEHDGLPDDYVMILIYLKASWQVRVTPQGVEKMRLE